MSRFTFPDSFTRRVERLRGMSEEAGDIMPTLEQLVWADNEEGLLKGQDRYGRRMQRLSSYTVRHRKSETGHADPKAPPLIPAYRESRAIANYGVTSFQRLDGNWLIIGAWRNFLTRKGVGIIGIHAEAQGPRRLPVRNIVGVRPAGRRKVSASLRAWVMKRWGE